MKQEHPTDTEPPSICFTSTNTPFMSLTDAQQTFISTSSSSQSQKKTPHFPLSERSKAFIKQHYPDVSLNEWNDWKWQVRHRIRSVDKLESILQLTETERRSIALRTQNLPIAITPYYLSLLDPLDPQQPLRRTHIPVEDEFIRTPGEDPDPLHEDHDMAVPGIVHRYPDRVLFLTTGFCSTYCRYCTRSRAVGETNGEYSFNMRQWEHTILMQDVEKISPPVDEHPFYPSR